MAEKRFDSRLIVFALLALVLLLSLLYSRVMRRVYVNPDLQYVPKENELVLVTGPIESLWAGVDRHFGEVIRGEKDDDESEGLAGILGHLQELLEEREVPVGELDDLARFGFDVGHGAIVSFSRLRSEVGPGAVVHITDQKAFTRFFSAFMELDEYTERPGGDDPVVISFGDDEAYLAFPRPDVATVLIQSDPLQLDRSLQAGAGNWDHVLENDSLYDAVRRRLGRPLATGPAIYGHWRPRGFPPLEEVFGVVDFGREKIEIGIDLEVQSHGLQVLSELLKPPVEDVLWRRNLPPNTAAALVVEDGSTSDYVRLLSLFGGLRTAMEETYGGVFGELRHVPSLRRTAFAWTGYRDGLPDWLMGLWAEPSALRTLVDDLQIGNREDRDRAVLEGALAAFQEREARAAEKPTMEDLRKAGLLAPEPHSLFERYPIKGGSAGPAGLMAADLEDPDYRREYGGHTFEYLLPAVSENDLRYLPEFEGQALDTVGQDRYRLATMLKEDVLWIASDQRELEALLDRGQRASKSLADNPAFKTAQSTWNGKEKIRGFIDVDRLRTLGLLSPESEVEEFVKVSLHDLKNHPVVSFGVRTGESENRLSISVFLFRRPAPGS